MTSWHGLLPHVTAIAQERAAAGPRRPGRACPVVPDRLRDLVANQGGMCHYCGRGFSRGAEATEDHLVPAWFVGYGSAGRAGNVVAACRPCNSDKGPLDAVTYWAVRGRTGMRRSVVAAFTRARDAGEVALDPTGVLASLRAMAGVDEDGP